MTVFNRIQSMSKDELQHLIHYIYKWGHINEQCCVDDECFYEHLLDLPERHIHNIIDTMDNLQLYQVREVYINGGTSYYLGMKFFGIDDATQYLTRYVKDITKVDDTTYATSVAIYKIIAC